MISDHIGTLVQDKTTAASLKIGAAVLSLLLAPIPMPI